MKRGDRATVVGPLQFHGSKGQLLTWVDFEIGDTVHILKQEDSSGDCWVRSTTTGVEQYIDATSLELKP